MKTRATLFIVFTVAIFALGVLITTLFNTAPTTKDAIIMFYTSGFLFLFGLVFFGLYLFNWLKNRTAPIGLGITAMVRTSLITDIFLLTVLAFRVAGILNMATTLVLLVTAIFLSLITRKRFA